jgi:hypothetical protein
MGIEMCLAVLLPSLHGCLADCGPRKPLLPFLTIEILQNEYLSESCNCRGLNIVRGEPKPGFAGSATPSL